MKTEFDEILFWLVIYLIVSMPFGIARQYIATEKAKHAALEWKQDWDNSLLNPKNEATIREAFAIMAYKKGTINFYDEYPMNYSVGYGHKYLLNTTIEWVNGVKKVIDANLTDITPYEGQYLWPTAFPSNYSKGKIYTIDTSVSNSSYHGWYDWN